MKRVNCECRLYSLSLCLSLSSPALDKLARDVPVEVCRQQLPDANDQAPQVLKGRLQLWQGLCGPDVVPAQLVLSEVSV